MALAESGHRSGRDALEAVIVGAEIMIRLGVAAAPYLHDRGFYVPSSVGPFGAAAACSRLLGFDSKRCVDAMAIAGSHSSGLKAFQHGGGSVKRIVCAIPSMAGLRAAVMAQHGITGPHAVIEGERGFLNVFAGTFDLASLTEGLGTEFLLLGLAFKPVACNLSTHAAVEAVGALRAEYGLVPDDVAAIEIGVSKSAIGDVGVIVEPPDILGAQSSLAFGAVVRMVRGGNGPHDYHEEDLRDPRCLDLAHRVTLHVDATCDEERRTLKNRGAVVTIRTRDGRALERRVRFPKGSPENPLTNEELSAKFSAAVEPLLGPARTAQLAEQIWNAEDLTDVGTLLPLTLAGAPAGR
jgi:2-methylcitrate dehydratase PrpD